MEPETRLELVREFVSESRELLDEAEPQIIELEQMVAVTGSIVDERLLNGIFRLFHTLKGSASFLDLRAIIDVTHEAETLLDLFRRGRAAVTSEHVDLLCRAADFIRRVLDQVEEKAHDRGFEEGARHIVEELAGVRSSVSDLPAEEGLQAENGQDNDIEITADLVRRFVDEALELCEEAEAGVLSLEQSPPGAAPAKKILRSFHSLKGNAAFLGLAGIEKLSHLAETIMDDVVSGEGEHNSVAVTVLLTLVDSLRCGIRRVEKGETPELPELPQMIRFVEQTMGLPGGGSGAEAAAGSEAVNERPAAEQEEADLMQSAPISSYGGKPVSKSRFIRVDTGKLDQLLDLVGELVIAESMVANCGQDKSGLEKTEKAIRQLNKITREMQEVALSLRMVPLTATFRKMLRLVRDLAKKENKQVELEMRGSETEVDKTVIELISDPLVHLIRNAVDHGIEDPAGRKAAGKPETGRVVIEARHSGGEVWIIVKDDGRGLDREQIIRKGVEKGIITEDDAENLADEDVWQLIFTPGFSTAKEISDISGRGVGMDVVGNNVEKINGRVEIHNRTGCGAAFVIRIPLTLAIIEGMIVKVGENRYTIPISSIKESFRALSSMITRTPDGLEVVQLRGELLPVARLHELYHIENSCQELTEGILIAVHNNEQKVCLFVDELLGQQQIVIKGLPAYLEQVRGISGCAILSDGGVSLILDIADLLQSI
jgi:two-component system chemotaxis sensor kinase CheA